MPKNQGKPFACPGSYIGLLPNTRVAILNTSAHLDSACLLPVLLQITLRNNSIDLRTPTIGVRL